MTGGWNHAKQGHIPLSEEKASARRSVHWSYLRRVPARKNTKRHKRDRVGLVPTSKIPTPKNSGKFISKFKC